MRHKYLVIEGNIGAGKTTLATRLAEQYGARLIMEAFEDNPFLPKFYKDRSKYAFPLEMSFLAERFQQTYDKIPKLDLFHELTIADYHVSKSMIFAGITLELEEFGLYRKFFEIMYAKLPKPDLLVYLHRDTEYLLRNIHKRGRSYELEIEAQYLESVRKAYFESFRTNREFPILVLDIADLDFEIEKTYYDRIVKEIDTELPVGMTVKNLRK
jgi:deoxyadenosine/deoxycytidine kinase